MIALRGGTWNVERDRKPAAVVASVFGLMNSRQLDFLCIQECAGYLDQLRRSSDGQDYQVIAFHDAPGKAESALIVRRDVDHGNGWQVRATRAGWFTVRGGKTPPKWLTAVRIAADLPTGYLTIVSGHTAPSTTWRGGRLLGPVRRVASMRQFAKRCVKFARHHEGPLLIACDWNATPEARGRYSPHWIARKAGLHVIAPGKPTHGSRVIDFALVRDCGATAVREKRRGSDHYAVTFKVTP